MQERHIPFEQLSDVIAFRVIVDSVEACYRALGSIHRRWPMVPGRFKDFISTPKRNGYRSLHTTVIHNARMRIEVEMRTRELHGQPEPGLAAQWGYTAGANRQDDQYRWLQDLLQILDPAAIPEELLRHTRTAMFQE